ncbi:hypothetical protein IFM89_003423 [Coptis chinensis]|uniref:PB1 domain-containing protein n=1 Tax=Coptis chinensis TaxID=261450 RepID=A0A835LD75_9MAGN|nr:hypothetical protein IFM89_003423 [Coptis chinensis]
MTSHQPSEYDPADSVTSSPRSDHQPSDIHPRVRFMCSFGGQILPRPHDNQLRYVGGDTRIVAVHRSTTFSSLLTKLSKLSNNPEITVKYQLPSEDLDALISVTTDEDVENMMDEYDRLILSGNSKVARLRLFLFPAGVSRANSISSISSLLDGSRREHWFFDALNGGSASGTLERGRSEVSSIMSEVPDYLFGLDNIDENRESKLKNRNVLSENVSVSDPGSPSPGVISSLYCSTTSVPDLPPVKTKVDIPITVFMDRKENQIDTGEKFVAQQTSYPSNTMWNYVPEARYQHPAPLQPQPMPVYYVPGLVPGSNVPVPVQVQQVPIQVPFIQRIPSPVGQIPTSYRHQVPVVGQVYGAGIRAVGPVDGYEYQAGMKQDGMSPVYY